MGAIGALAVGVGLSAVGSIIGGIGASKAAKSEGKLAEENAAFQAEIARENAAFIRLVSERNAQAAIQQSVVEADRLRRDRERRISATTAAFARTGIALSGSPIEALAGQAAQAEEDVFLVLAGGKFEAQQARIEGEIRARNQLLDAIGFNQQGDVAAAVAENRSDAALFGGIFGGVAQAVTGFGQVAVLGDLTA